jgi:diacylglycerol kinase (ATP)
MPPRRRTLERHVFLLTLVSFLVWTAAVASGILGPFDAAVRVPLVDPRSPAGQVAEAFALVTHPFGLFTLTLMLALWALRRRLRRLALALALSTLGLPAYELVATLTARPRPPTLFTDSVSAGGLSYPSGHVVAATIVTWVAVTIANAQRKSDGSRWRRQAWGGLFVAAVAADQWALSAQWESDVVGGVLLGATVASGALWLSVVDTIRRSIELRGLPAGHPDRRAAIIYNPTKVLDFPLFRRRVDHALLHSGWKSPLWLETTREDPGRRMAREALAHHVDLVLVAGGDGTVRAVCAGLAGSGIPVGLVPAGTGNLLCRNLGIPLDEDVAIEVALHGVPTAIDMVSCTTDTGSDTFAVMAGVGLDALIMSETNPELKRAMRGGAYVVAAAQQVRMKPFGVRVTLDGQDLGEQPAVMALVGNVGRLQGGIQMFPEASPTDGLLDVLVASPDGLRDWARVAAGVRTGGPVRGLARAQGSRVEITVDRPIAFQLDGDTEGDAMRFVAEVVPGALRVMLTREPPGSSRPARDTAR